jgi:anti-sigma factor RsiW
MNCQAVLDKIIESQGDDSLSRGAQIKMAVHLFFCPRCAAELKKFEAARNVLKTDFFAPPPNLEDAILERIYEDAWETAEERYETPAGVSLRGWVITGLIVLFSLVSSFFGMDFEEVAASGGSSFLLPVGLTVGVVVTGYGALFIGSHLKELTARFRLH